MTTSVERLEELLNERDAEIEVLQDKLREAENAADNEWTRHLHFKKGEWPNPKLPVPRLEVRWVERDGDNGYTIAADYCLVYQHLLEYVVFVPLGSTKSTGTLASRAERMGQVDLPFREHSHLLNDMKQLGLRAFGICGGDVCEYLVCSHCGRFNIAHRTEEAFGKKCSLDPLEDK